MTAYSDALAREAIDEAISHGCTLEGLQDALTRRLAEQRLSPPQEAPDRAFNRPRFCSKCLLPTYTDIVHTCTSEAP